MVVVKLVVVSGVVCWVIVRLVLLRFKVDVNVFIIVFIFLFLFNIELSFFCDRYYLGYCKLWSVIKIK